MLRKKKKQSGQESSIQLGNTYFKDTRGHVSSQTSVMHVLKMNYPSLKRSTRLQLNNLIQATAA